MGKHKILIIDDDRETRNIYAEVFRYNDFEVDEAEDGMDGLDKAIKNPPHVIFTGIIMPRMDGFALLEALKKNAATSGIPVFISSHRGREEDRIKAEQMGAKDFIVRDMVTPKEVVSRIRKQFEKEEAYKLEINSNALDAQKLEKDLGQNYKCVKCGSNLAVILSGRNGKNFNKARIACPKCD